MSQRGSIAGVTERQTGGRRRRGGVPLQRLSRQGRSLSGWRCRRGYPPAMPGQWRPATSPVTGPVLGLRWIRKARPHRRRSKCGNRRWPGSWDWCRWHGRIGVGAGDGGDSNRGTDRGCGQPRCGVLAGCFDVVPLRRGLPTGDAQMGLRRWAVAQKGTSTWPLVVSARVVRNVVTQHVREWRPVPYGTRGSVPALAAGWAAALAGGVAALAMGGERPPAGPTWSHRSPRPPAPSRATSGSSGRAAWTTGRVRPRRGVPRRRRRRRTRQQRSLQGRAARPAAGAGHTPKVISQTIDATGWSKLAEISVN